MNVDRPVRVMIVDDSAYMRKVLREMLDSSPLTEVAGTARDGNDALEQIDELRPDVAVVDLVMPGMDGAALIRALMERKRLPVVVCSSTSEGSKEFLAAMEAGAVEFVAKPTALALEQLYSIRQDLIRAVMSAAAVPGENLQRLSLAAEKPIPVVSEPRNYQRPDRIDAVVIGVSTGGPQALRVVIPRLPANLPVPVIVALHIPAGYTKALAETLNAQSQVEVLESDDYLDCIPGRVILAKAGMHTNFLRLNAEQVVTVLSKEPIDSLYCPSVDELFRSAAEAFQDRVLAVVMTGMGNDGTAGAGWIKGNGGLVFAESEETSVVFGMPRSVIEAGLVDRIITLDRLPEAIMEVLE